MIKDTTQENSLPKSQTPVFESVFPSLLGVELNLTVAGVVFKTIYFCQNWELGSHILELGT